MQDAGTGLISEVTGFSHDDFVGVTAMDYAAFQLLKRLPLPIAEARTSAQSSALRIFGDVAAGKLSPESYGAAPEAGSGKVAIELAVSSRRRVTSQSLEGL